MWAEYRIRLEQLPINDKIRWNMTPEEKKLGRINYEKRLRDFKDDQIARILRGNPADAYDALAGFDMIATRDVSARIWESESEAELLNDIQKLLDEIEHK